MKLSNRVYDIIKYALFIFIPAFNVLLGQLGNIYGFDTETIRLTIDAIALFIGTIAGISNYNYKKGE